MTSLTTYSGLEEIWAKTQAALQPQMTKATYETIIVGTKLVSDCEGVYRIETPSSMSQEWLEYRLKDIVKRTLANVLGYPAEVEFAVAIKPDVPAPEELPLTTLLSEFACAELSPGFELVEPHLITLSPCANFAQQVDFQSLWFEKGRSTGFTQVPDYAFQFWMLYLNQLKPKTFDLYLRIISDDKRNVHDKNFTHWTPARKYSIRALARAVGTKSVITITGGPRSCWFNEQAKKNTGSSLPDCCGRYEPAKWHQTTNGTVRCQHWQTGLLEVLFQEGLVAIQIVKPPPNKPRSHEMWLQAWRNIPLLTPYQVEQLSEVDQLRHAQWIERYGHFQDIDLVRWEQLRDSHSLVPFLPDYDLQPANCPDCVAGCLSGCSCRCHKGRQYWGIYCPERELFECE